MDVVSLSFGALQNIEIHQVYQLRAKVFVVEQHCPYQDVDDYDLQAEHILGREKGKLIAYARIIPPGLKYLEPSIGRVVVDPNFRKQQLGRALMKFCISRCRQTYQDQDIVISAQTYLLGFYSSLGFVAEGEAYEEDEIPHRQMRLKV